MTATLDVLTKDMPTETAVAWAMSAATVHHATRLGLIDPGAAVETGLEQLAGAHNTLAGWADPTVNRALTHPLTTTHRTALNALATPGWVADATNRPDGWALGDLYQELSIEAVKGRALVQTPRFVVELLLDLAVDPAVAEWGADTVGELVQGSLWEMASVTAYVLLVELPCGCWEVGTFTRDDVAMCRMTGRYTTIVADPPWPQKGGFARGPRDGWAAWGDEYSTIEATL